MTEDQPGNLNRASDPANPANCPANPSAKCSALPKFTFIKPTQPRETSSPVAKRGSRQKKKKKKKNPRGKKKNIIIATPAARWKHLAANSPEFLSSIPYWCWMKKRPHLDMASTEDVMKLVHACPQRAPNPAVPQLPRQRRTQASVLKRSTHTAPAALTLRGTTRPPSLNK